MSVEIPSVKLIWGVQEPKPIRNAPVGQQRLRMRNQRPAKLYVRTPDGIRCATLIDAGDHWLWDPKLEQGRNQRMAGLPSAFSLQPLALPSVPSVPLWLKPFRLLKSVFIRVYPWLSFSRRRRS